MELFEEEEEERFVFVDKDDEGGLRTPPREHSPEPQPLRKKRNFKLGTNSKNKDLEIVDPFGQVYKADDGMIKINWES